MILCNHVVSVVASPFSFLILLIWVLSLFLVSLDKGLPNLLIFSSDVLISECALTFTVPKEEHYYFKQLAEEQKSQSCLLLCQADIPSTNHPLGEASPENIYLGRTRTIPSSSDSKGRLKNRKQHKQRFLFLVTDIRTSLRNLFG